MTEQEFKAALKSAKPGDEIVYHTGFHCLSASGARTRTADVAWREYLMGKAILYQRRIGPAKLQYCAKVIA
jgi:hypothetical protein